MPRAMLRLLLLAFWLLLSTTYASTPIACPPGMQCTPITILTDKLADDVATLKRDNEVLKQRLDDLNSHEANQIGMLANQTSYLGTLIGIVSAGISLIAIVVGLFVRRRTDEVVKEFEHKKGDLLRVAELEIDKAKATNAQQLQAMADVLKADFATEKAMLIQQVKNELQTLQQTFEQHEESYRSQVQDKLDTFDRYLRGKRDQIANDVLASGIEATPAQQQELAVLSSSSHKPASLMTAEDYYNVALAAYSLKDHDTALEAINTGLDQKRAPTRNDLLTAKLMFIKGLCQSEPQAQIECYQAMVDQFAKSTVPAVNEEIVKAMINLGVAFGNNNQLDQAIHTYQTIEHSYYDEKNPILPELLAKAMLNLGYAYSLSKQPDKVVKTYKSLVQRYGDDGSPTLRASVNNALNNIGFTFLMQAKQAPQADRLALLQQALDPLQQAFDRQPETELKAMVLGNLGYSHFLLGQPDEAERYTRECLQLGEDKVYQAQQKDAQQHRLEPEDSEYEAMLHRVWQEVSAAKA